MKERIYSISLMFILLIFLLISSSKGIALEDAMDERAREEKNALEREGGLGYEWVECDKSEAHIIEWPEE